MLEQNTPTPTTRATATISTPTLGPVQENRPAPRWSAPIPSWVFGVTDLRGKPLQAAAHLLAYLWTRADAPSKRRECGPTFVRGVYRVDNASIARDLGRNVRNIERQFAVLVAAGLVFRGEHVVDGRVESGIWLADADHARFVPAKSPGKIAGRAQTGEVAEGHPAKSPVEVTDPPGDFAGLYKEARSDQDPYQDPDRHDHVEIAPRAPDIPDPPHLAESASRPGGRAGVTQQSLFGDEPSKPTGPTRDPAQEVFDYLASRIVAAKTELGIKPAIGPRILGKTERRNIDDRIREHGKRPDGSIDFDAGVEACKRVVDVDEADCVRVREISQYWNATTPFRNSANFEGRLMRWREDGEHQVWGVKAKGPKPRTDYGFDAYKPDEDFVDATGELCMGRNSMLAAVEWK